MTSGIPVVPRWEWRTFGERFPGVEALLDTHRAPSQASNEIYILGPSDDINVKIRAGQLDAKRRLAIDGDLELWSPVLKADFPIDAATIAGVFADWTLAVPALSRERYTDAQFLADLVGPCPRLRIVHLRKARRQASIGRCIVEVATLDVEGQALRTAALESQDPDEVRNLAHVLGLTGHDTANYVAALRRLTHAGPDRCARLPLEGATS